MIEAEFRRARPAPKGPKILTGIAEVEAETLEALVHDGSYVLEIGSAFGYSALVMAAAGAHVLTIDSHDGVNKNSLAILDENIRLCGLSNRVFPLTGDSAEVLAYLLAVGACFDGVFVDGGELETEGDVAAGWELLRRGGWLARHDYGEAKAPAVARALDKLFPGGPDWVVRTLWIKRKATP